MFFKRNLKNEVLSKVYCVKLKNQDNLMIMCKNHLNVSILASSKYNCTVSEGGVLIQKMNKCFCKGCVKSCLEVVRIFLVQNFLIMTNFVVAND